MEENIEALRVALAAFDENETVRFLWPVLDAARAVVREFDGKGANNG